MNKPIICLLIDDDPDDHQIFYMALKQAFPEAICSCTLNCIQATDQLRNKSIPTPEYIFMDWNLPYLEAKECIQCLQDVDELKNAHIFILSGFVPFINVKDLDKLGLKKVLKKQNTISLLSKELSEVLP
ncbi:hypothetical protein [Dyadobacter sp. NIV53]|uniref:hypothetical protein n=1 Tax=Dyadobacter sp. NIV53 TaxID=2861765 RepID=UPI001C86AA63|nr:hypothetical protein [Dyadobacter sp. NIV53]